jgi:glucose-6-phosphate isomerase
LSVWYNNFFGAESEALIPYTIFAETPYLQQGTMESNGKVVGRWETSTVPNRDYYLGEGTNAQHAFFQLIHQGTKLIPADFIGFVNPLYGDTDHHDKLMSNLLKRRYLQGKSAVVQAEFQKQGISQEEAKFLLPFKVFGGTKPTNTILIDVLSPKR